MTNLDEIYRREAGKVLATLIRLLGSFELAEEAMHDAFAIALEKWPVEGTPENPTAWLISTARFKAIDQIRKRQRQEALSGQIAHETTSEVLDINLDEELIRDDQLRLIFTCCHPALAPETQMALTLREICALTTEAVAAAFLKPTPTIAQRIVRGKAKIKAAGIPYEVPERAQLPERLSSVLSVIYLVFNEGYSASSGDSLYRAELSKEAIRLARLLHDLLPEPEVNGLLGLLLLTEARQQARSDSHGEIILLEHQDRNLWDATLITEGRQRILASLATKDYGSYTVQGAIAAVHSEAKTFADTDWQQIIGLYDVLYRMEPSPVIELNRAVAIAMHHGPDAGLDIVKRLLESAPMQNYHLAHATAADLHRRAGRAADALRAYRKALTLCQQEPEQRFLQRRINSLSD